jgi:Flp pilus assembly protein TadG
MARSIPFLITATKIRAFLQASGAIAVEFGFIFIILIMLLGVIEVSTAISANLAVQAAAHGAHFGLASRRSGQYGPVISAVRAAAEWVGRAPGRR